MQISRLFQILYILLQKRATTAKDLAAELEVSVRTIYRDIDHLGLAGIPVYTTQGRGGGVFIPENYTFSKAYVSEKEQDEILMALQSLPAATFLDSGDTQGKLQSLFQKEHTQWVDVDFTHWGSDEKHERKFRLIKEAILEGYPLTFQYANSQGDLSERTVFPLKLLYKSRSWYLSALDYAKHSQRIFKINRMIRLTAADPQFLDSSQTISRDEVKAEQNSAASAMVPTLPSSPPTEITLRIEKNAVFRAYDEFAEEDIHQNEDGSYTVKAEVYEDNWIYGFLLSLGPDAKILSPPHLQRHLATLAERTAKLYEKD